MATKNERQPEFTRNDSLEGLLDEINVRLAAGEPDLKDKYPSPSLPVLMVIGPPRSGTTVTMQWLANSGYFAYPTNLLSRFYGAPYVGALIQQLIFDPRFNYKNELFDHNGDSGTAFRSDLGKTKGPTQPNEFWYFWRRFVDIDQAEKLSQQQIDSFDRSGFLAGLASLQAAFGKPWVMKGILLQYDLQLLNELIPKLLFISMNRDVRNNAFSLLRAREKFFGDINKWFSVRPPGFEQLLEQSAYEQVVGQVALTHQSIKAELASIPDDRFLEVQYSEFCTNPESVFKQIKEKLSLQGFDGLGEYSGPSHFEEQDYSNMDGNQDMTKLEKAIETFASA